MENSSSQNQNSTIQYPDISQVNIQGANTNQGISTLSNDSSINNNLQPSMSIQEPNTNGINLVNTPSANEDILNGITNNDLNDIIPGEKIPRALKRAVACTFRSGSILIVKFSLLVRAIVNTPFIYSLYHYYTQYTFILQVRCTEYYVKSAYIYYSKILFMFKFLFS